MEKVTYRVLIVPAEAPVDPVGSTEPFKLIQEGRAFKPPHQLLGWAALGGRCPATEDSCLRE